MSRSPCQLVIALSLLVTVASLREPFVLSRRSATTRALAGLAAAPTWLLRPQALEAGPFDSQGPQLQLGSLRSVRDRLDELAKQISDGGYTDSDDDAIVVLRTSSVYFKGVDKSMVKVIEAMPLLSSDERKQALELSTTFGEQVLGLNEGCRNRSSKAQLVAVSSARDALSDFLGIAAVHYKVPDFAITPYSSSPTEFSAQYFGFFSCEGQGLERIPGSNSCKDPPNKPKGNSNSFKLDFDFLTGKKL